MPGASVWIAGSGDLIVTNFGLADFGVMIFGLADFMRLPCDAGLGQAIFGVHGFMCVLIPGEAGTSTEDLGSGFMAPDRKPMKLCWVSIGLGGRVLSASLSAFTGNGEGTYKTEISSFH